MTHLIGATQIIVGLSATVEVVSEARVNQWSFKKFSGNSLAIVAGASNICSEGYMMGDSESISVEGPAKFYLAAAGATVVVHLLLGKTAGA